MSKKEKITTIKTDTETREKLKEMRRQLSALEQKDLRIGDVVKRIVKGDDILNRLKIGSIERRRK